jgi:hypothetical protein
MDLAEPPGRAAGGTAPLIVVGLDGSPASGRRLRDPCAVETERPPAPVFVVPPASQPARYAAGDAGRRAPSCWPRVRRCGGCIGRSTGRGMPSGVR